MLSVFALVVASGPSSLLPTFEASSARLLGTCIAVPVKPASTGGCARGFGLFSGGDTQTTCRHQNANTRIITSRSNTQQQQQQQQCTGAHTALGHKAVIEIKDEIKQTLYSRLKIQAGI